VSNWPHAHVLVHHRRRRARNRTRLAVERTVPFGLVTQSLVIIGITWLATTPPS